MVFSAHEYAERTKSTSIWMQIPAQMVFLIVFV